MSRTKPFADLPSPTAQRRPVADEHHGIKRLDDYAWLRADNWQEVFRDPDVLAPEIRTHLEAENTYQEALMADTTADLYESMPTEGAHIRSDGVGRLVDMIRDALPAEARRERRRRAELGE